MFIFSASTFSTYFGLLKLLECKLNITELLLTKFAVCEKLIVTAPPRSLAQITRKVIKILQDIAKANLPFEFSEEN